MLWENIVDNVLTSVTLLTLTCSNVTNYRRD